jgi:hypothetical protein
MEQGPTLLAWHDFAPASTAVMPCAEYQHTVCCCGCCTDDKIRLQDKHACTLTILHLHPGGVALRLAKSSSRIIAKGTYSSEPLSSVMARCLQDRRLQQNHIVQEGSSRCLHESCP